MILIKKTCLGPPFKLKAWFRQGEAEKGRGAAWLQDGREWLRKPDPVINTLNEANVKDMTQLDINITAVGQTDGAI